MTDGETSSGTTLIVLALGCVGSLCNKGMFEQPAVLKALIVLSANAVAGEVTNAVISVCNDSAVDFAASKESSVAHEPPLVAVLVVSDPRPFGPLAVVLPSQAA